VLSLSESHVLSTQIVKSYSLLVSRLGAAAVAEYPKMLSLLSECLTSSNTSLVVAVGVAFAVVKETVPNVEIPDDVFDVIVDLASEVTKHKAKAELKEQRQALRAVAQYLEEDAFTDEKLVVFHEKIVLTTWSSQIQMGVFRDILGGGLDIQLHNNEFVRAVLDLGDAPAAPRHRKPQDKAAAKLYLEAQRHSRSVHRSTSREHKHATQQANDHDDEE